MLRISIEEEAGLSILRLEGRLIGPWVAEAQASWRRVLSDQDRPNRRIDLTGVTMIDVAGKDFLAVAHSEGAELVASGCLMRALVAEVTQCA